ncbi:thioredoxin domain-containing protein [Brevibacillus humidisoli]|uniref:thioredoxin family protein n=1 Tax=Brevibacillus humidisoli TaxID=2895522 RepID=UPI001E5DA1F5|nr:thioredoxin domain-containing protein [Brevibacillus humidisoli]UFJ39251.1 thioredoxin domain-containing protein [Brevibacillus humidisoli]
MKKIIIFLVVVIALFAALGVVTFYSNKQAAQGNPYGKETLHAATIEQLDDPLYGNQITPDELQEKLDNKEELYVYFYDPTCPHCKETTPILVPLADELKIDVKKHNVLEFQEAWQKFQLTGTPTLIHFKDGKEVGRLAGGQEEASLKSWFEEQQ